MSRMSVYDSVNRNVLSRVRKDVRGGPDVTSGDRQFHTWGPATVSCCREVMSRRCSSGRYACAEQRLPFFRTNGMYTKHDAARTNNDCESWNSCDYIVGCSQQMDRNIQSKTTMNCCSGARLLNGIFLGRMTSPPLSRVY